MAGEITEAISCLKPGQDEAVKHLPAVSYDELRRLAPARLWASRQQQRFATESLVHESCLRLVNQRAEAARPQALFRLRVESDAPRHPRRGPEGPASHERVEMRFFGGMTEAEVAELAEVTGISARTLRHEWTKARAALLVRLEDR